MKRIIAAALAAVLAASAFAEGSAEKIQRVLSRMSPRAQRELSFADADAFVAELDEVLAEEKKFRQGDLSLYHLIDKKHNVGADYVPTGLVPVTGNALYDVNKKGMCLRPDVEAALRTLSRAANADGLKLLVSSTYRSYKYQENLFNYWVRVDGLEEAERESARPGTSQHQLGSAVDFGSIDDSFAQTKMGRWLSQNAHKYGWSLSFPKEYEDITGYRWECWHYRYIGVKACGLQRRRFNDVQQYMLEFIDLWKKEKQDPRNGQ